MAHSELDVFLAKVQGTIATAEASLLSSNFAAFDNAAALSFQQNFEPINLASGLFGQEASVLGTSNYEVKLDLPIIPTGSTAASNVDPFLQASGMSVTTATNKKTYAPSSDIATDWKDQTVWKYSGNKVAGESLLSKAHSIMYDWKLTGKVGSPAILSFTGMGATQATPAAASYVSGTLTMPSNTIPAVLKATTMSIMGITFEVLEFEVGIGNKLVLMKDPTKEGGYSRCIIADRKSTWSATVLESTNATKNPFTNMITPTLATCQCIWGTAGSRVSWQSGTSKGQINSVEPGNEDGINTYKIGGIFVDNSLTLIINDD